MNKNKKTGFDTFLTDQDELDNNITYIKPDIELKLSKKQRDTCRDVVQEIKNFGIKSQREILYLIYLLSLEIENPVTMEKIVNACKTGRKDLENEKRLIV